jgi:hypothetical protein
VEASSPSPIASSSPIIDGVADSEYSDGAAELNGAKAGASGLSELRAVHVEWLLTMLQLS